MKFFHDNLRFFGAPAGLFFVIDRSMGNGQWAHMGMFMQSIALAAEEMGVVNLHARKLGAGSQNPPCSFSVT